jgi:hypothetical protein
MYFRQSSGLPLLLCEAVASKALASMYVRDLHGRDYMAQDLGLAKPKRSASCASRVNPFAKRRTRRGIAAAKFAISLSQTPAKILTKPEGFVCNGKNEMRMRGFVKRL